LVKDDRGMLRYAVFNHCTGWESKSGVVETRREGPRQASSEQATQKKTPRIPPWLGKKKQESAGEKKKKKKKPARPTFTRLDPEGKKEYKPLNVEE